ncbi:sulfotransferase [Sphingomonas sp. JC676]|nr:sulfotransferase [Sphingomonas sp. JC676]
MPSPAPSPDLDSTLAEAARAIAAGRLAIAYPILAARLKRDPGDVAALRLMAMLAIATGRDADALKMLDAALEQAPGFEAGWHTLAELLHHLPPATALAAMAQRRARRPGVPGYQSLHAGMLERTGDYDAAVDAYRAMLARDPKLAGVWITLGHALKTIGDSASAVDAYRRSIALRPESGEPWWALADLKSFRFTSEDVAAMEALLARGDLSEGDRAHVEFAIGRALEDAGDPAQSFAHYAEGNRLRRGTTPHDPAAIGAEREAAARLFTPAFFAERAGAGSPAADPIFIVGLPRSGSTLVEQILASHSAIEGTRELGDLPEIVRGIALGGAAKRMRYPEVLTNLSPAELTKLGDTYLEWTRCQRRTDKPHFIDKLPANFRHVGLIRLILPNAKVIDVRRDLPGCGFSIFKQQFASGFTFGYSLEDIAAQYRGYAAMMALWDDVLPGFVHHLDYAALVADTEGEVRRMLDYLGLAFEPACLDFHRTARAVRTPSGDQVRQPIFREGLEGWKRFAPWLGPLLVQLKRPPGAEAPGGPV